MVCDKTVPLTFKEPVIDVDVLTLNPSGESDAVTEPVAIWDRFNPVTPLAGKLYKPAPSPMYDPVKYEAETDPEILDNEPYNSINL